MPHSPAARLSTRFLCTVLALTLLAVFILPMNASAGFDVIETAMGPGGDGQPDDFTAPQPGFITWFTGVWSGLVRSIEGWMGSLGWGGLR